MQTTCPDCTSNFSVTAPGIDPGAFQACDDCGGQVQSGAFLCPGCKAGLQVVRSLLPAEGANGRCPDCSELVWIPPLAASSSAPSIASAELSDPDSSGRMPTSEPSEESLAAGDMPMPHVLGDEAIGEEVREDSFLDGDTASSNQVGKDCGPDTGTPSSSHRTLGFFLGLLVGAGTAVTLILTETWAPPLVPWQGEFPFALETTWAAAAGLVGGALGMLFGGRKR